ncbi:hypothetical protein, partial [Jiangella anatolica]|uniref:hypothetical protein n=1 Tax=Jiangella anatolica TaxID=2670374 RepID=UPI001F1F3EDC
TTMVVASSHLISDGTVGPAGGHISVGATPRSYQVTPAGPSHPDAGKTHEDQTNSRQPRYEPDTKAIRIQPAAKTAATSP